MSFAGVKTLPPGKGIYGFARAWRPAGAQGGGVAEKAWNTRCEGIVTPPMETFFCFNGKIDFLPQHFLAYFLVETHLNQDTLT